MGFPLGVVLEGGGVREGENKPNLEEGPLPSWGLLFVILVFLK